MKRLVAIGDSIVHGTCSCAPFGLVEDNFVKIIGKSLGFEEILNFGVNGTTVSTDTDWRQTLALSVYIDEIFPAEFVVIASGTNDYGKNVEIGTEKDTDCKTFYGALNTLFTKAKNRFDNVLVIAPIKRKSESANLKGYTLEDYRNALYNRAKAFGFYFIDGGKIPFDFDKHIPDGLHPNALGHQLYASYLLDKIRTFDLWIK